MKWYIPSWNGDIRVVEHPDNPRWSRVIVHKPTAHELQVLGRLADRLRPFWGFGMAPKLWDRSGNPEKQSTDVKSPVAKIGAIVSRLFKAGEQTLTKIVLGETILIAEGTGEELDAAAEAADQIEQQQKSDASKSGKKAPDAKAASVKRPTPCCPQCIPGAIAPATEVLLSFLTPEQHREWAQERCVTVRGNLSGHRYLLAHRHTPLAREWGRICYDMDDDRVLHFHDWSVPPEEEVLAAKMVLEHREHWLRHEATLIGAGYGRRLRQDPTALFKNPFGGGGDGVRDARMMAELGREFAKLLGLEMPRQPFLPGAPVYYTGDTDNPEAGTWTTVWSVANDAGNNTVGNSSPGGWIEMTSAAAI